ncbi:MAG: hypothetical protein C0507_25485 [Cyanobacteria bacterium PR.3.49]|nr:hypothetical protein [Cyanobacteria bacterium PR.3.49]
MTERKWTTIQDLRIYHDPSFELELKKKSTPFQKDFSRAGGIVSQRYARKLEELGLQTPVYHHLYAYFSTDLQPGSFGKAFSSEHWNKRMEIGVSPEQLFSLPQPERDLMIGEIINLFLLELAARDELCRKKILNADEYLRRLGGDAEFELKTHSTKNVKVRTYYTIDDRVEIFLDWEANGKKKKGIKVASVSHSYFPKHLVSRISVKNSAIMIFPRTSENSKFYLDKELPGRTFPLRIEMQD